MKILLALLAISLTANSYGQITCSDDKYVFNINIDTVQSKLTLQVPGKNAVDFKIYSTKTGKVKRGEVNTYSIKDGMNENGWTLSGDLTTLSNKNKILGAGLVLINDDLGNEVTRTNEMKCK